MKDGYVPMDNNVAPERVWEPTRLGPDGRMLYGSREWLPGEKAEYVREHLIKRKSAE